LEKPVTLQSQGEQMIGMLHLPGGKGPFPAVAIYHGFTGTKVEPHRIFVKMARALVEQGIAAVRFDFRGSGDSEGDFANMTVSGEIADGIRVLDFLQEQPLIDRTRLGVVGLSMGGAVAASVAGKDERVKSLVLWAAVALFDIFEKEEELLRQARELGYADLGGNVLNYSFYEDARTQEPLAWAAKHEGPALIIHGDEDPTVPVAHANLYYNAFPGTKEKFIVPGADHTFNRRDWEEKVINKTAEWFCNTL
jgi:dipeptidyl aminopeptidase/acylaminoacyl peptidase